MGIEAIGIKLFSDEPCSRFLVNDLQAFLHQIIHVSCVTLVLHYLWFGSSFQSNNWKYLAVRQLAVGKTHLSVSPLDVLYGSYSWCHC